MYLMTHPIGPRPGLCALYVVQTCLLRRKCLAARTLGKRMRQHDRYGRVCKPAADATTDASPPPSVGSRGI